jgi:hypothetical protein
MLLVDVICDAPPTTLLLAGDFHRKSEGAGDDHSTFQRVFSLAKRECLSYVPLTPSNDPDIRT